MSLMKNKLILITTLLSMIYMILPAYGEGAVYNTKNNDSFKLQSSKMLKEIAQNYNLDAKTMALINNVENSQDNKNQQAQVQSGQNIIYKVREGDTLTSIAKRYNLTVQQLAKDNEIVDKDDLLAGKSLNISGASEQMNEKPAISDITKILKFIWPVNGITSSLYGDRNGRKHQGLDIAVNEGVSIKAAQSGKVIFVGPRGTYGNAVILQHQYGYTTLYAHASKVLVSDGEMVVAGSEIAKAGNTGRSTGPHLHFEIRRNKIALDPLNFLPKKE